MTWSTSSSPSYESIDPALRENSGFLAPVLGPQHPALVPDRPLTRERQRAVRELVLVRIHSFLDRHGYATVPSRLAGPSFLEAFLGWSRPGSWCEGRHSHHAATPAGTTSRDTVAIALATRTRSLEGLCDFLEWLVKEAAGCLHADLIGGANVTRLDRMLRLDHARLDLGEARSILARRGFTLEPDGALDLEASASLIRYCGLLPVQLTGCGSGEGQVATGMLYLLPFAGIAGRGVARNRGAGAVLQVEALLRFFLGQEQPQAAVAHA
jgi:hypothetical protein